MSSSRYTANVKAMGKFALAFLSIAALADDRLPFQPKPAADYENKVTLDQVTIAVEPYDTPEKRKAVFGKVPLEQFGVLPMLVVIQNSRKGVLNTKSIRVRYRPRADREIDATPAADVPFVEGPSKPRVGGYPTPYPLPLPERKKKMKLKASEIDERAWAAPMIESGDSAYGFFYFRTDYHGPVTITVSGLRDAASGQELFFFELPLNHR